MAKLKASTEFAVPFLLIWMLSVGQIRTLIFPYSDSLATLNSGTPFILSDDEDQSESFQSGIPQFAPPLPENNLDWEDKGDTGTIKDIPHKRLRFLSHSYSQMGRRPTDRIGYASRSPAIHTSYGKLRLMTAPSNANS
ncbi:hypothetical protein RvY_15009 [Ramazzottius varieornatus]|uniref:Uncharacterized protein n=1 Tax=Ramazzottius varieornatus TaxID=947166 RepID=A0A1D1VWZ3_RAMVA|nr:hypothetical protein RvY_15009 [Ramazzottius varieornatus]